MAIEVIVLPKCDVCGELWLPQPGLARDDPRKYDAERRAKGEPPLRCGKCKSPQWDRNYTGDRRRKHPPAPNGAGGTGNRGLLHCPQSPLGGDS